jgi:hypothetical protein
MVAITRFGDNSRSPHHINLLWRTAHVAVGPTQVIDDDNDTYISLPTPSDFRTCALRSGPGGAIRPWTSAFLL